MAADEIGRIRGIYPDIGRELGEIASLLYEQSDLEPVGVYLHGSLAMNCFHPGHSDLDLLVVYRQPATPVHRRRWAAALAAISAAPCPVELSVLHGAQIMPWQYPTPYDFHWSEAWRERYAADGMAGDGCWGPPAEPDPDLAAHLTVARRRGLCLAGQPLDAVPPPLPDVPWGDYLDSIVRDLAWAAGHIAANPVYATLNACRVWAAQAEGLVLSKAEGAIWAAARLDAALAPVVAKAGAWYAGVKGAEAVTAEEAAGMVAYVRQR